MQCPKCGGDMIDKRATKTEKQPDFSCADPNCVNEKGYRTGVWLQSKRPVPSKAPQSQQTPRQAKWTWPLLAATYSRALLIAKKYVTASIEKATTADILAGAHTIFITAARDGVQLEAPKVPAETAQEPDETWPE